MTTRRKDRGGREAAFFGVGTGERIPPIHPGEILKDDFPAPMALGVHALANAIKVPRSRIDDLVHGRRAITTDTALRLARYFGTTPKFWINLQVRHDLEVADMGLRERIEKEVSPRPA